MISPAEAAEVVRRSSRVDIRRARYTTYVSWVVFPVVVIFPFFNDYTGLLANVILGILGVILAGNLLVYYSNWELGKRFLPFIGAAVAAGALLYFAYLGWDGGSSLLWIYIFPLFSMFMLGILWGTLTSLMVLATCLTMMSLGPEIGAYLYTDPYILRFGISFSLVIALALGYEYWRVALEIEKETMNDQLTITRMERDAFADLANVCPWCNSVKLADGTWLSLELYVENREEKRVSHSICPTCYAKEKEGSDRTDT